jgi:hypothetical protein
MKRIAALAVLLLVPIAACGGDDDDDGSASASASGSEAEVASGDFCDVWQELNSDQEELTDEPTEEQLDEAREILEQVEASAPEEIEDEVTQLTDAIGRLVDQLADGGDIDAEEVFGEVFGLAFTAGPPIEEWMVENCPDYDPNSFGVEEDDGLGVLDIPQGELDDIRLSLMENDLGASSTSDGDEHEWTWYFEGDGDAALAVCEEASAQLAEAGADGTLVLRIATTDETVLAVNDAIAPGNPGSCEVPS